MSDKIIKLSDYQKDICGQFDEHRILNGEVSFKEIEYLEEWLTVEFFKRAKERCKKVVAYLNKEDYEKLRASGSLFDDENTWSIYVDELHYIIDLGPVIHHLMDTPQAQFYIKLRLHGEYRLS